jgi:hypothetical protein
MEVLIAMGISLVVTASMIALMANSLGTTARIIKMTKLSDDMRIAMQMMTRDVRRSSYNSNAMYCYANKDCGTDGAAILAGDISINDTNDCFSFLTDRDFDGDSTENAAGGFRRVITDGVGVIEMWTGDESPNCGADAGTDSWRRIVMRAPARTAGYSSPILKTWISSSSRLTTTSRTSWKYLTTGQTA